MSPEATGPIKFGVMLNHEAPKGQDLGARIEDWIETTELTRDLGFDALFGIHHYLSSLATLQPLHLLSRLVPHSGEMRLGIGVYLGGFEHPIQLAESTATVDQLSGGRLILGLGAGFRRAEFDAFGLSRPSRWTRLAESVELMKALWSGDEVNHEGEHFTLHGGLISVRPKQKPRPPVWIGANAPATITRAASIGDTWLAPPNVKQNWAKGNLQLFKKELADNGKDAVGREYPIIREMYVTDTDEAAVKEAGPYIHQEYVEFSQYDPEQIWKKQYEDLRQKAFLFGTADTVAERVADMVDAGFTTFIFRIGWSDMPLEMSLRSLRRFADEVVPRFR